MGTFKSMDVVSPVASLILEDFVAAVLLLPNHNFNNLV